MSNQEKIKTAKEYIDKQMETMRSHGVASKTLSETEYQSMIKQAAKTILR